METKEDRIKSLSLLLCGLGVLLISIAALIWATSDRVASDGAYARPEYRVFKWKQGQKPQRMIHQDEGFCFLSGVGGGFAGGGEVVHVTVNGGGGHGPPELGEVQSRESRVQRRGAESGGQLLATNVRGLGTSRSSLKPPGVASR